MLTTSRIWKELLEHLLKGKFAPRSDKNIEQSRHDITLRVRQAATSSEFDIVVPDVTGELWESGCSKLGSSTSLDGQLGRSERSAALLACWFRRKSPATRLGSVSKALGSLRVFWKRNSHPYASSLCRAVAISASEIGNEASNCAAKGRYCDLRMGPAGPPNTVRDRPWSSCGRNSPLLAGKIENISDLEIGLFGVSVVGGDLQNDETFLSEFNSGSIEDFGYTVIVHEDGTVAQKERDLTIPLNWLMEP